MSDINTADHYREGDLASAGAVDFVVDERLPGSASWLTPLLRCQTFQLASIAKITLGGFFHGQHMISQNIAIFISFLLIW